MQIQPINNQNNNFKGKLILKTTLSENEKQLLTEFSNIRHIKRLIRRKPYDITVERCPAAPKYLEFSTKYNTIFSNEQESIYLSLFDPNREYMETNVNLFRDKIKWFDNYKKDFFSYNNLFEKIKAIIKFSFEPNIKKQVLKNLLS